MVFHIPSWFLRYEDYKDYMDTLEEMMIEQPDVLKIRVSRFLLEEMFTRDADCNRLMVEIGEPDGQGFYIPTIHTNREDNPKKEWERKYWEAQPHIDRLEGEKAKDDERWIRVVAVIESIRAKATPDGLISGFLGALDRALADENDGSANLKAEVGELLGVAITTTCPACDYVYQINKDAGSIDYTCPNCGFSENDGSE